MTESSETYPRSFILAEAMYPVSRVTKCTRRHPPSSARARACASLSFDCFDGNRAESSSTLESRPRTDLFHFLFSFAKKEEKNATLLKASGFFFFSFLALESLLIRSFFMVRNNEDMRYIKKSL